MLQLQHAEVMLQSLFHKKWGTYGGWEGRVIISICAGGLLTVSLFLLYLSLK